MLSREYMRTVYFYYFQLLIYNFQFTPDLIEETLDVYPLKNYRVLSFLISHFFKQKYSHSYVVPNDICFNIEKDMIITFIINQYKSLYYYMVDDNEEENVIKGMKEDFTVFKIIIFLLFSI